MFKKTLEAILERTEGSTGALIMGTDGIAVEKVLTEVGHDTNLDVAAAEFTALVRTTQRLSSDIGLGALNELVLSLESGRIVVRLLNSDYFLMLALKQDGNLGRGRFELRKAELELAREFAV